MYVIPRKEEKISGSTYATRRVAISPTLHTKKKKIFVHLSATTLQRYTTDLVSDSKMHQSYVHYKARVTTGFKKVDLNNDLQTWTSHLQVFSIRTRFSFVTVDLNKRGRIPWPRHLAPSGPLVSNQRTKRPTLLLSSLVLMLLYLAVNSQGPFDFDLPRLGLFPHESY